MRRRSSLKQNNRRRTKNKRNLVLFSFPRHFFSGLFGLFSSISIFSKKNHFKHFAILALVCLIAVSSVIIFDRPRVANGQTYSLTQNSWSGGVDAGTVNAPTNLSGWNKYESASGVTAGASSVVLAPSQSSVAELFDSTTNRDTGATNALWDGLGQLSNSPDSATNLTAQLNAAGITGRPIYALLHDSEDGLIYLGATVYTDDNYASFAKYDIASNTVTDLTTTSGLSAFIAGKPIVSLTTDGGKIYLGGTHLLAVYDPTTGVATNIQNSSGMEDYVSYAQTIDADPVQHKIYVGGIYGQFAVYDVGTGLATNLAVSSGLSAFWGTDYGDYVNKVFYNSYDGLVYLGGTAGQFAVYNPSTGQATNLAVTSGLSAFWGTGITASIIFCSSNNQLYLAGNNGSSGPLFASYSLGNPGVATNLTVTSGITALGGYDIASLGYDPTGNKIYLSSYGQFNAYTVGVDGSAVNLNTSIPSLNSLVNDVKSYTQAMDVTNGKLYIGNAAGGFGRLNIAPITANAISLSLDATTQNIASATLTKNDTPGTGTVTYQLSNNGGVNYATVTPGVLHAFSTVGTDLRFKISFNGNATIQDVSIDYNYYPATGNLVSSKFDSADATNIVNRLTWTEDTALPAGTTVTVSLRTADSSDNLTGAWTDLTNASSNCTKDTGVVTCIAAALPAGMQDGSGDRWFQYRIVLGSTGINTPTVSSTSVQFVVNAPPEVRNVVALQNANGTVTISYEVRDVDTQFGSPANQDHVTPSFEYWNGVSYQAITTLAAGDTNIKAVNHDGSWNNVTYTATWTAKTDFNAQFMNNTAKVRVTANDGEGANPTGSAESATYTLDTLNPSANTISIDASTVPATIHLSSTDNSSLTMKVSAIDPTLVSTDSEAYATTKSMTLTEGATVYVKFTDAVNNSSNIISATVPATPTATIIQDISNVVAVPHAFRMFLAWKVVTGPFATYRIHRSTTVDNPELWSEVVSIGIQATNFYVDNDVVEGGHYYYYVKTVDGSGNISFISPIVNGSADGTQSGGEGGGGTPPAPVITVVSSGTPKATQATITWETDTLSDSVVGYSLSPSTFTTSVTVGSLVNNAAGTGVHSVILTDLLPEQTYFFRVSSTDINDRTTTDANGGVGYTFITPAGPIITNTTVEQTANTGARISWATNTSATSVVVYSVNSDMSASATATGAADPTTAHTINLTGLLQGTQYFFYVKSVDGSLNETMDKNIVNGVARYYTFTTTNDIVAPVITLVTTALIADTSAVITWVTDEPATSRVIYGTTVAYGSQTAIDSTLTISHSVTVSGLTASTPYYYKVVSADAYSNSATKDNTGAGYTFTTTAQPGATTIVRARSPETDQTPPQIINLRVGSIGKTSAIIEWSTDEPADTIIKYGTTIAYGSLGGSVDENISSHQVNLAGLSAGTIYHFIAVSSDAAGNQGTSSDRMFATLNEDGTVVPVPLQPQETQPVPDTNTNTPTPVEEAPVEEAPPVPENPIMMTMNTLQDIVKKMLTGPSEPTTSEAFSRTINELAEKMISPPSIVGVAPRVDVAGTTATISWTTDKKATSAIAYATESEYNAAQSEPYAVLVSVPDEFSSIHEVKITNLLTATKYHFQVRSKGLVGGEAKSLDATFQTTSDLPVISSLAISEVQDTNASLSWTTNVPTNTEVKYKNIVTNEELVQGDTAFVRDHKFQLENLKAGAPYSVTVNAEDEFGNQTSSRIFSLVTSKDNSAPEISKVSSESTLYPGKESRVQTIISWDTNEPATTHVFYQEGLGTDATVIDVPADNTLVSRHTVVITKFRPTTVYKFWVESTDATGNTTKSKDYLILTPQQKATVIDIIIKNFEQVFGWTKKLQ